tara:strand:+ start:279 stop:485 length:207 start_codon:yes stop_codon:yes gene_type:complete
MNERLVNFIALGFVILAILNSYIFMKLISGQGVSMNTETERGESNYSNSISKLEKLGYLGQGLKYIGG